MLELTDKFANKKMMADENPKRREYEETLSPGPQTGGSFEVDAETATDIDWIRHDSGEAAMTVVTEEEFEAILGSGNLKKINKLITEIESITPGMARKLVKNYRIPFLELTGLKEMSVETIMELVKFGEKGGILSRKKTRGQSIKLEGLEKIGAKEAEALAKFEGDTIMLNGITSLDKETARALAKFRGKALYLNGLTSISLEIAGEMADFKVARLMLKGIKRIGVKEASALAKFKGSLLDLSGLEEMDFETARELRKYEAGGRVLDVNRYIRNILRKA